MKTSPTEQVIYLRPALCHNRGCNRPIITRDMIAWHKTRPPHEIPDPTFCLPCNQEYQAKAREAMVHDGGPTPCVPWSYYDEDANPWPRGSY